MNSMDRNEKPEKKLAGNWCKSVSAFANGSGGTLMLSLDDTELDPGRPVAAVTEQIEREVEPLPEFDVLLQQVGGKQFLVLNIFQGKEPPYYYIGDGNKIAYFRDGNQSVPADDKMLSSLMGQDGLAGEDHSNDPLKPPQPSFDSQVSPYDFEDVSFTKLKALYRRYTNRSFRFRDFEELGLAHEGKLTYAGLLLADEAPVKQSLLICARWEGNEVPHSLNASDYKQFSGGLLTLLQGGIEFVKHNSRIQQGNVNGEKQSYPDYPRYCVAEGLSNALVHCAYGYGGIENRDCELAGGEFRIDIYDDRLEIRSPGGLLESESPLNDHREGLPVAHPQSPQVYRNPVIAKVFQTLGCMKGKGVGLKQIQETYEKQFRYQKEHQPELCAEENSCVLVLPNLNKQAIKTSDKKITKKTVANKEKVLEYLKNNGVTKTPELSQLLNLSGARTRILLNELIDEGLVKANGRNKGRTYELVE